MSSSGQQQSESLPKKVFGVLKRRGLTYLLFLLLAAVSIGSGWYIKAHQSWGDISDVAQETLKDIGVVIGGYNPQRHL